MHMTTWLCACFPGLYVYWLLQLQILITIFMEITAEKKKATGEKGPATALDLGTYALSRSFSHASHGDRSRSFVPHRSYVPVAVPSTGEKGPATALELGTYALRSRGVSATRATETGPFSPFPFAFSFWAVISMNMVITSIPAHKYSLHIQRDRGNFPFQARANSCNVSRFAQLSSVPHRDFHSLITVPQRVISGIGNTSLYTIMQTYLLYKLAL